MVELFPALRKGVVTPPYSKSFVHRILIGRFLAGVDIDEFSTGEEESDDILATRRCLKALQKSTTTPTLDCGESGSTLRFLAPVAAALGRHPKFVTHGRLADPPVKTYDDLKAGVFELRGDVSSQFVTGLLFALPLLKGDSEIRFTTPLESVGYVKVTLEVLQSAGVEVRELPNGFAVPGDQSFHVPACDVERDWSSAAFWIVMNELGSDVKVNGLNYASSQPDSAVTGIIASRRNEVNVSQCPDLFPALCIWAGHSGREIRFTGIRRLRLKESDRVSAMADVLNRFGVKTEVADEAMMVHGISGSFRGGTFCTYDDHRIMMAIVAGSTIADAPVSLDNEKCVAKSYPEFWRHFEDLRW